MATRRYLYVAVSLFCCGLMACSGYSAQARRSLAEKLAQQAGWRSQIIPTPKFSLFEYEPKQSADTEHAAIYIEGDGMAWLNKSEAASDPTPREPMVLNLAIKHKALRPEQSVFYLARPCQYVEGDDARHCQDAYWTGARFSEDVIAATSAAIDTLKQHHHFKTLTLVGYSGGAAVAALTAARRKDIVELITIAGNVDHQQWTEYHRLTPLSASLNPVDVTDQLARIRQLHLVGAQDNVVPAAMLDQFVSKMPRATTIQVRVIEGYDHYCCWLDLWPSVVEEVFR